MKKWIWVFCLILLVAVSAVYILIPSKQLLSYAAITDCAQTGASRILFNKEQLKTWWPGEQKDNNLFSYKNYNYKIKDFLLTGIEATVYNDNDSLKGMLTVMPTDSNTAQIIWESPVTFSINPVKRLLQYFDYVQIKKNIEGLITDTKKYLDNPVNVYGMNINKQMVAATSMISFKQQFNHYPSVVEIYGMIEKVKDYIKQKGGEESNYPMLNVYEDDSTHYEAMVAIPTKTDLPTEGNFSLKKFPLGYILMAEKKGGIYAVINGEKELVNYANDYQKHSPAIPFQSLVTNRLAETDSSKWITNLYYPIFY